MSRHCFRIPASTSNLGAGFDSLGLALTRYLHVTIETTTAFAIEAHGMSSGAIPTGAENLVLRVAQDVAARRGRILPTFRLTLDNEIPLAKGLGSSGAAIIAGITCYELMTGDRLSEKELFQVALKFESHPDNLAAALYGGLISAATTAEGEVYIAQLKVAHGVTPLVVIPEFELLTETARKVLPKNYSRADTVYNIQRAALTIAALTTGKWSLLRESMRDRIHQPYRNHLIPGLDRILDLEMSGLAGVALSGAGPTIFAIVESGRDLEIGNEIVRIFNERGVRASSHSLEFDSKGRVITES
jgi:homoserine kinase